MADIEKVVKGLECCNNRNDCKQCPYANEYDPVLDCIDKTRADAIELLKEQNGLMLALEQANATINYLNEEKEKAINEIEERKAFNLKCDGQPEWLRKGIDVGLNTALDILKGKDGEQECLIVRRL